MKNLMRLGMAVLDVDQITAIMIENVVSNRSDSSYVVAAALRPPSDSQQNPVFIRLISPDTIEVALTALTEFAEKLKAS